MVQDRFEKSEHCWQSIGMVDGHLVLLVVHTVGKDDDGTEVLRIISDRQAESKEGNAMNKTVKYEVDLTNLPPLTATQKAELETLAAMSDNQIDHTDVPPLTEEFWKQATKNPFYRPTKQATTVRVDSDVLLWLKSQGKGYQTRINAILREAMLQSLHPKG